MIVGAADALQQRIECGDVFATPQLQRANFGMSAAGVKDIVIQFPHVIAANHETPVTGK